MSFTNLSATLSSALSGLNVAQASINATAHNIVNANTEGFSRQTVSQESRVLAGRGAGVESGQVQRIADEYLTGEVRRQAAITGRSTVLDSYQNRAQDAFGSPSGGNDIGSLIGSLQASLEAFGNDHETLAFAFDAAGKAGDVVDSLADLSNHVEGLRNEANREIDQVIQGINADLKAIDALNNEIAKLHHTGDENPDLLDKRDLLIRELAEKIEIDTYPQDHGTIAVYTSSGEALVDYSARVLHYGASGSIAPGATLPPIAIFRPDQIDPATGDPINPALGVALVSSGVRAVLTPELQNDAVPDADQRIVSRLGGGRLQGLVELRDQVFPELDDQLQELAAGLRFALNAAHNEGVAWPQPNALSGTRTDLSDFAGAVRSGTATLAVTDTDGSTLLAFEIDLAAAADENDVVAQLNTGLGAFGTATIGADGQLEITLADADQGLALAEGDSSVRIIDAAGRERDYGFSHYFGLNDLLVGTGTLATDMAVRPGIAADPSTLATARLDVETPPLTATLGGPGDNRAAQGLAQALAGEQAMIARGALPARTTDLGSYAAEIVALTAMNANRAEEQARADLALADAVGFKAESVTAVNLDEELSALITLQQSYTVAARLITAVNEMLDELVDVAR